MSWTDERVELLKKLWSDGLSASQIAGELGGISRNSVIGKAHRLGVSGRAQSPSGPAQRQRTPPMPGTSFAAAARPWMGCLTAPIAPASLTSRHPIAAATGASCGDEVTPH